MTHELAELQSSLKSFHSQLNGKELTVSQAWLHTFQSKVDFIARELEDKHQLEKSYLHLSKQHLKMQKTCDDLQRRLTRELHSSSVLKKTNTELTETLRAIRKKTDSITTVDSIDHESDTHSTHRTSSSMELDAQLTDLSLDSQILKIDKSTQIDSDLSSVRTQDYLDLISMLACSASATESCLKERQQAYEAFVKDM